MSKVNILVREARKLSPLPQDPEILASHISELSVINSDNFDRTMRDTVGHHLADN